MPPHPGPADLPVAALVAPDILALLEESPTDIAAETEELHPADLADVVELLPPERVPLFLTALPRHRAADVLEYRNEELRAEILEQMSARQAAELVTEMTPDDRADTLEELSELSEEHAEEVLSEIPSEARRETEQLLRFDPDSAGGLMTTEFVSVPAATTVEDALDRVRALARSGRREAMYAIYATDADGRLAGVLSLRELLAAAPGAKISDIAWTEIVSLGPNADREEVARLTSNYDLDAIPVVSESGHLMGRVAVRELPAGLTLGVILGVIGLVRIELWQLLHDHSIHIFGVPLGMNYNQHPGISIEAHLVALTVGLALVGVVTFGTMVGSMLPFLFRRIGFDPASASAPFVATLVDVTGLVIYFTVALVVLHGVVL